MQEPGKIDRKPEFMVTDSTTKGFFEIDWQLYHKKNIQCLLYEKSPAQGQDDGSFEGLCL